MSNILCPACGSTNTRVPKTHSPGDLDINAPEAAVPSKNRFIDLPARASLSQLRVRYYECADCEEHFATQETYFIKGYRMAVRRSPRHDPNSEQIEPFKVNKILESLKHASAGEIDGRKLWLIAQRAITYLITDVFQPITTYRRAANARPIPVYTTHQIGEAVLLSLLQAEEPTSWTRYSLIFYELSQYKSYPAVRQMLDERWHRHLEMHTQLERNFVVNTVANLIDEWEHEKS